MHSVVCGVGSRNSGGLHSRGDGEELKKRTAVPQHTIKLCVYAGGTQMRWKSRSRCCRRQWPGAEKCMVVAGKMFSGDLIGGPQDTQSGFRLV
jgi:hypothetical protein